MSAPTSPWWRNFDSTRPAANEGLEPPSSDFDDEDEGDSTRTFARSLYGANGAFPQAAEYGNPITYVGPSTRERIINLAWWAASLALIVATAVWIAAGAPLP